MHGFRGNLIRMLIVLLFGLVSFWPNYGLTFLVFGMASTAPVFAVLFTAVWIVLFALFLPISVHMFRMVSVVALGVIDGVAVIEGYKDHLINPLEVNFWLTWGVGAVFLIIGWLLVATPLWRFFHGIVATQETHHEHG